MSEDEVWECLWIETPTMDEEDLIELIIDQLQVAYEEELNATLGDDAVT